MILDSILSRRVLHAYEMARPERAALAACPCPPNGRRLVHVWRDRQREPEVRQV